MNPCQCESSVCEHNVEGEPDDYGLVSCPKEATEVESDYGLKTCKECGDHYREYRQERYNEAMQRNKARVRQEQRNIRGRR